MIEIQQADITTLQVDAIVNAANSSLLGGGGVDGAIHKAAGKQLLEECRKLNGCPTGQAKITKGYNLNAKYIIHTVGPIWSGGYNNEAKLLAQCYSNSLRLALSNGDIKTMAFPNISTGVYGFPKGQAARIAIETTQKFLRETLYDLKVIFVTFDQENYKLYANFNL